MSRGKVTDQQPSGEMVVGPAAEGKVYWQRKLFFDNIDACSTFVFLGQNLSIKLFIQLFLGQNLTSQLFERTII